jgi:hypothetical protein
MAFTGNYSCNTLRTNLMTGAINFSSDTFYLALYTNAATLNAETTEYTPVGEASGISYLRVLRLGVPLTLTSLLRLGVGASRRVAL